MEYYLDRNSDSQISIDQIFLVKVRTGFLCLLTVKIRCRYSRIFRYFSETFFCGVQTLKKLFWWSVS